MPSDTDPKRTIKIAPVDRLVVSWEPFEPIERPENFCFDQKLFLHRILESNTIESIKFYRKFRRGDAAKLNPAERENLRSALAPTVIAASGSEMMTPYKANYLTAALVGCSAEVKACVANIPEELLSHGDYHYWGITPQWLLFGLPGRAEVISEFHRLGLFLGGTETYRSWLALTEFEGLDMIGNSICKVTNKTDAAKRAKIIHDIIAPEMALPVLKIATASKAPQVGREWLKKNPIEATVGLAELAATGTSNLAKSAREILATFEPDILEIAKTHIDSVHHEKLIAKLETLGGIQLDELPSEHLPKTLTAELEKIKAGRLPNWLSPNTLPPIQIDGKKLANDAIKTVLTALRSTPIPETSPLFAQLKTHAEPNSLDQFAWKLFEAWVGNGTPAKDKWALGGTGHLGGDHCVLQLVPLIRSWPAKSAHQRSLFALDCLRAIGSDTALMTLSTVGTTLKYKSVTAKAEEVMAEIAADRGVSIDALGDCIIPDCGLDKNGSRSFDYGPRQFEFVLGPASKPMVRDGTGKLRVNPPKPNKSDDALKSEAATAEWKTFKKSLQQTLKIQADRMSEAMVAGREWTLAEFEKLFIHHPFMLNLARQLVFVTDSGQSFRITEDQSLADIEDNNLEIPQGNRISVLHPARLSESDRAKWGELLSDYAILPPFPQIGREFFSPQPDELNKKELKRKWEPSMAEFIAHKVLRNGGWDCDEDSYQGPTYHSKFYPAANTTAIMQHTEHGIAGSITFVTGKTINPKKWKQLKIKDVDLVAFSETLRTIQSISEKPQS